MTKQEIMKIFKLTEEEAQQMLEQEEARKAENWKWIEENWVKE